MAKKVRQYGLWESPISARSLGEKLRLSDVQWDTDGETLVWLEGRGKQGVLVAQNDLQAPRDLNSELSVRGGVGYGGGEYCIAGGWVYFCASDGRLYRQSLVAGPARPVTPAFGGAASPAVSHDGHWLVYVHHYEETDGLAIVDAAGEGWPRKLVFRADFYMQPVWHPSGSRLAYIAWNVPNMPWDGTELRLATLDYDHEGAPYIATIETIAGDSETAIFQPEFSPDGRLLAYVSDAPGWGQLYLYDLAERTHVQLTYADAEHGAPAWVQGTRMYGWSHDSRLIYSIRNENGFFSLWRIDVQTHEAVRVKGLESYTHLHQISVSPRRNAVALLASSSVISERVISVEPESVTIPPQLSTGPEEPPGMAILVEEPRPGVMIHRRSSGERIPPSQLAPAQPMQWPTPDGETAHGLYYAPASEQFEGVGKPPLIVYVHGGPTSQARALYSPNAQFFATRGFAFLEVNYRGSTGYGRAYQDKLRGAWGVYDVEDSAAGVEALIERGLVDGSKVTIMGGSAGGFTVLMSLIKKPGFYRAGVCFFGVSNQFTLSLKSEFKFEAHYNDSLLGPLPAAADVYRERSPVFHAEKIVDPIILFQGTEDNVVPQAQSESIVSVLRARRVPHEYHVFEGEGHGWRKPETIETFYELTLSFLERHVLFA